VAPPPLFFAYLAEQRWCGRLPRKSAKSLQSRTQLSSYAPSTRRRFPSRIPSSWRNTIWALIPSRCDHNLCAHSRVPIDMFFQGMSTSLFQAKQQ
jgi:hypothetical protein